MRADPLSDVWDFLVGATAEHQALGLLRWLFVGLFGVLLATSALIALARWLRDPDQRGAGPFVIWICRLLIGGMWFQCCLWKLPLPVSGALQYWTEQVAANAAYGPIGDLVRQHVLPHLAVIDPILFALELGLAVSFMLGVAVRPVAALGAAYALVLWLGLYRHPSVWPWAFMFLAVAQAQFAVYGAGGALGTDGGRDEYG